MRAGVVSDVGGIPALVAFDRPDVDASGSRSLVKMLAAGVNQVDISVATGVFPTGKPAVPYIPGVEGVGLVEASSRFPVGSLVRVSAFGAGYGRNGVMAEYALVDNDEVEPVPDGVSPEAVVATGNSALTGWLAVRTRGQVHAADRVLVLGATGASGWYALQAARHGGARSIVAVARNAVALRETLDVGATATVDLQPGESAASLAERYEQAAHGKITVTYDALWGVPALAALRASAPGARHVVVGQAAADTLELPCYALRVKAISLLGFANHQISRETRQRSLHEMLELAARGELRTFHYKVFPFADLIDAWNEKASGRCRRPVVRISEYGALVGVGG